MSCGNPLLLMTSVGKKAHCPFPPTIHFNCHGNVKFFHITSIRKDYHIFDHATTTEVIAGMFLRSKKYRCRKAIQIVIYQYGIIITKDQQARQTEQLETEKHNIYINNHQLLW
uniref:Uncharacterized protein n=1 Tax=Pyxicephalus adspersus TaxID=30357 RepID=A0AAV2ZP03_PYXAD|nr:TPA: hypothetical protein GDO54_002749 [Pyxicephalus adspersus]